MDGPFADPTIPASVSQSNEVTNAGGNPPRINAAVLDGYNPFVSTSNPSGITNGSNQPPPYSASDAKQLTTAELERRQRELDAKAAELARREEEQRAREEQSRSMLPGVTKNWPPLPSSCPCAPCFYQNIDVEIIPEYQKIVKWGYYLWSSYAILLIVNFVGALIYFAGTDVNSGGTLFGMAILAMILCIPSSYVCWFRPLYKAFKNNSSVNFFIFFLIFGAQILVMIIQSIGILDWGSCGWITGFKALKSNPGIGGVTIIISLLFTGVTTASVFYLLKVHSIYRSTGASFGKAREEFARGVVSDPFLRNSAVGLYAARQPTTNERQ